MFLSQRSFIHSPPRPHLGSGRLKTAISCLLRCIDRSLLQSQAWKLSKYFSTYTSTALEHSALPIIHWVVSTLRLGISLPSCGKNFETFISSALSHLVYH